MTWTYTNDPQNVTLDAIRVEIYDIDEDNQLLSDEVINYAYSDEGSTLSAAARCCEILAAKFANQVDKKLGPLSVNLSDKSKMYYTRGRELRKQAFVAGVPYAGGISDDKDDDFDDNSDLVQPDFDIGMMDNE